MFNNFDPIENKELKKAIDNLCTDVNFPCKKIEVVDGSKRDSHSNAYFTGFGNHLKIVLFDTILQ